MRKIRKFVISVISGLLASALFFVFVEPRLAELFRDHQHPVPRVTYLEYTTVPRIGSESLDTLDVDNRIEPNQDFCFKVKLQRAGFIYLLHEDFDGSMKWVNPLPGNKAQVGEAGESLRLPSKDTQWIALDNATFPESFLIIFVPVTANQKLVNVLAPSLSTTSNGFPLIPAAVATSVHRFIGSEGVPLEATAMKSQKEVSYQLRAAADSDKPAYFYQFSLDRE